MYLAFRKEEQERALTIQASGGRMMTRKDVILLLLLVATLLAPNYAVRGGSYLSKVYVWAGVTAVAAFYAWRVKSWDEIKGWLKESWWFVRTIFPFLLIGVFIVGIIGAVLPQEWIETWLGGAGLRQSFLATMIGS
ncbi:unnamed protein product, partial [marine sediment metagenome]